MVREDYQRKGVCRALFGMVYEKVSCKPTASSPGVDVLMAMPIGEEHGGDYGADH